MLKNIPMCIAAYLLLCQQIAAIDIREAIKQKLVKANILWKSMEDVEGMSLRHGNNIKINLQNLTAGNISVEVPCGTMFTPKDTATQNMVIAEDLLFVLEPKKSKTEYAHGYCCEAGDAAPAQGDVYFIKKPASPNLVDLTRYIRDKEIRGYAVQRAVWCVSNNYDLWDINAGNPEVSEALIRHVGGLKKIQKDEIDKAIARAYKNDKKVFEQQVEISFVLEKETNIWIVVHDINNNTVKMVAAKQKASKGLLKKTVGLSSIDVGCGDFYVRVYSENGFVAEKKISLDI